MKKRFCERCLKDVVCDYKEENVTEIIDGKKISYLKKYYECINCKQIIYDDLFDYNVEAANKQLRKMNDLITVEEMEELLEKYNIGKKPASCVLGLGEITLTRYLDGQNPTKENSDFLKMILANPNLYELYLMTNEDKITEIAFKKSLGKTKQLILSSEHSKLYSTALYIIKRLDETSPLTLQKLLYFINGFSKKILNNYIFNDRPEAWVHGPVYREIYDCFSYYKYDNIDYSEVLEDYEYNLSKQEQQYINKMLSLFGCYSGKVLREMTHLTDPWVETRKGLSEKEPSMRIIEDDIMEKYFDKVCSEYNINEVDDIRKYSLDIFKDAVKIFDRI